MHLALEDGAAVASAWRHGGGSGWAAKTIWCSVVVLDAGAECVTDRARPGPGSGAEHDQHRIAGNATPAPQVVFAIERHLQVPPGALSQHLGYVPISADDEPFIDAIMRDRRLSDEQRDTLLSLFRKFTGL